MLYSVASRPKAPTRPIRVGTAARSINSKLADIVSPKDFGAIGNAIVDDAKALQEAINFCQATGNILDLGPGRFRILTQLNIIGTPIRVIGAGWSNTSIELGSTTMNGIVINTNNGCHLSDFQMLAANNGSTSLATAGSQITITGPSVSQISTLRNVRLVFGFTYITFGASQVWTIDDSYLLGCPTTGTGIVIQNSAHPGNGELQISNTLVQGGDALTTVGGSGVFHASGVNLKIVNSEIFGWTNGYNLTLGSTVAMAGTFISNSVFSQVENAITLNKGTGTSYGIVSIIGNEILARNPIAADASTGWLSDVTIVGNILGVGQGTPASTGLGTGISLPAVNSFTVIGNVISGSSGNNSIVIGANAANGFVAGNQLRGNIASVSNVSTTTLSMEYLSSTAALNINSGLKSAHATSGVGYGPGAGSASTQGTSRATAVTNNTVSGSITLFSTAPAATPTTFTVNNTAVAAGDAPIVVQRSGADKYRIDVTAVAANSFNITFLTTGTTTEAPVFGFSILKGST